MSEFSSKVLKLVSGNIIAHLITAIAIPILTRLYNPEQFGHLSVFLAISGVMAVVFSFRMDLSVYSQPTDVEKISVVSLGCIFIFFMMSLCYIILVLFGADFLEFTNLELPINALLFTPFAAALLALYTLLSNYSICKERVKKVSLTKVARALTQSLSQILLAFMPMGLILGDILGRLAGVFGLFKSFLLDRCQLKESNAKLNLFGKLREQKPFFYLSTPTSLINSLVLYSPQIAIASLYSPTVAGVLLMSQRLVAIPMAFLGQSLSQVYSSKLSKIIDYPSESYNLFKKITMKCGLFSLGLFGLVALIAPFMVGPILGSSWTEAGVYIALLCPMFAGQLFATPIVNTANILSKQSWLLVWDLSRLCFVFVLFLVTLVFDLKVEVFLLSYSVLMLFMYITLFVMLRKLLSDRVN